LRWRDSKAEVAVTKERATDLFSDFERIRERMEQAWQQVIGPPGAPRFSTPLIDVSVDVFETEEDVVVVAEIAGISEEEVEIIVDGTVLILSGERHPHPSRPGRLYSQMEVCHGPFRRELVLPADVDPDRARATYSQGMLEIVLPKAPSRMSRQVKIVVP
jgi:HSP20 family protein